MEGSSRKHHAALLAWNLAEEASVGSEGEWPRLKPRPWRVRGLSCAPHTERLGGTIENIQDVALARDHLLPVSGTYTAGSLRGLASVTARPMPYPDDDSESSEDTSARLRGVLEVDRLPNVSVSFSDYGTGDGKCSRCGTAISLSKYLASIR